MHKKTRKSHIVVMAIILAVAISVCFVRYLEFAGHTRNREVASQLSEVYGQINNQFNDLAEKNWNMLKDTALAFELSQNEDMKTAYIEQLKEHWSFNEWLFVDEDGNYIDTKGHTGYLNLGRDFILLTQDKESIVVDGTLAGSDPVILFVVPVKTAKFRGFGYSAVAIAYKKEDLTETLADRSYDGSADSYLLYSDGRVLLSLQSEKNDSKNLFTLLKTVKFKETDYESVRNAIRNGGMDTCKYSLDGINYYLYYQPVGFQDWMIAGIVPQNSIGKYVDEILRQTTLLSSLCFAMIFAFVVGIVFYKNKQEIRRKDEELRYRQRMFEILSNNDINMFIVMIPDTMEVEYVSSNSERVIGIPVSEIERDYGVLDHEVEYLERPDLKWGDLKEIPLGGSAQIETVRRNAKTGEKMWFEETVYRVKIGEIERYIFVLHDRTKDRNYQTNLETALDIAKAANASKSAFLSSMSHDIRTPMNVIIGFLPLLQKDADDPDKVRDYARKIGASSHHLLGLINDVLDLSKIESGKTTLNAGEFLLADMIEGIALIIRPQASSKQQEFDIFVQDIRFEHLIGDAMKLNQIMVNILTNAVKYTPCGGKISLTVQQLPQITKNIVNIRFTVKDNGIGMSEEYQKVIFEPFTREENSKVVKARGTGLGMSIVKNLIDLMGGKIFIDSRPGEGSTFIVELGLRIHDDKVDFDFWKKHSLFRTLIVDDDREICSNVVQTVLHSGLEMEYALSGREAVEKVRRACQDDKDYDLVLLDWKMPGMDGLETAARIRQIVAEDVPILILTAYDWSEIEAEARAAGIDGFLPKPFFLSSFMDTVDQVCSSSERSKLQEKAQSSLSGRHFLVAEDYELNAEILAGILEMYGITCDICVNGSDAFRCFKMSEIDQYDLILMDIRMPVMNGCEATREIRKGSHPRAASVPIIAMSANAFSEDVQEALESGMNAYLTKPVDINILEKTLIEIFDEKNTDRKI